MNILFFSDVEMLEYLDTLAPPSTKVPAMVNKQVQAVSAKEELERKLKEIEAELVLATITSQSYFLVFVYVH